MVDDRTVTEISFKSKEEASQFTANLPVTVGTITYKDGDVEYVGYVGDHAIGYFETEQAARIAAARFDRRNLLRELDI